MIARLESGILHKSGIMHGFFTRNGGVSTGVYTSLNGGVGSRDEAVAVLENRARMAATLGIVAPNLLVPYQVHSSDVVTVSKIWGPDTRPTADGLVTNVRGLGLGATGADCGMVLFADAENGVIGACHSGWKGALNGIIGATIAAMLRLGACGGQISAVLGPCIHQPSYEVGAEFRARFIEVEPQFERFFIASSREAHFQFDLPGFIGFRAREAGVGAFENLGRDTYAEPEQFFSYRRSVHRAEPDYGRLISAIALV